MANNRSSLISVDDVNGIYSVSDFLNYMPDQLSWSDNKSFVHLKIFFSSQDHQIRLKNKGSEPIKEKIKSALQFLDICHFPTLVQFWAPKEVDNQQFLETFDFPFGISVLRKGLCWYRKKCLNYKYSVDGESNEEEYGPVGRVFRNGFPEFSPDVSLYSAKEYKLRDSAVTCDVKGYLALPVFESGGKHCVGVLELISIWDASHCLTDKIGKVEEALKAVGLRSSKTCSPIDMERSSQHKFALSEIKKLLEAACRAHKLPFAQAWFCSKEESCSGDFLCTSEKGSYMLAKKVSFFQKECIRFCLKKGQSVVWRAFTSGTSCFCRDVKQLRITEYSFVNIARKFDLTSCFAICLQSTDAGNAIFVLEFFLPSSQTIDREQAFLNPLLATVKRHSQSFKVASGQELGAELPVEEIKLYTDNELDVLKRTPRSPQVLRLSQNEVQMVKLFDSESNGNSCCGKEGKKSQINDVRSHSGKELGSAAGNSFELHSNCAMSPPWPEDLHKRKADNGIKPPPHKRKACHSLSQQEYVQGAKNHNAESNPNDQTGPVCSPKLSTNSVAHPVSQATAIQIESPIMVKASYEENIIKFQLSLVSGITDFENEVEKRLELKAGSYEIKHLNDDNRRISLASDADLQNFMRTMISLKKTTVKLLLEPVKIQHIEKGSNSVVCPLPQTTQIQNEIPMIVKVTHKDDMVKFQLPLSAGIMEFKDEVIKRLKLKGDSFGINYLGEANEWIPIANDAHLRSYMSNMRSKQITTIRFSLDPITN